MLFRGRSALPAVLSEKKTSTIGNKTSTTAKDRLKYDKSNVNEKSISALFYCQQFSHIFTFVLKHLQIVLVVWDKVLFWRVGNCGQDIVTVLPKNRSNVCWILCL